MKPVLVIGYGNPLRGDDGLGEKAVEMLRARLPEEQVTLVSRVQLTPDLAERLSSATLAIFIDARADHTGSSEPGSLFCEKVEPVAVAASKLPQSFSHHCTPSLLLTIAQLLYGAYPQAYLLSVTAAQFEVMGQLSAAVNANLPLLVERVYDLIAAAAQLPEAQESFHSNLPDRTR